MSADNQNQILINDFSAGWCPSDDAINGRKNGLLKMDGVTLDQNGALILGQGMVQEQGPYASTAHSFFQKIMCGERRNYVGLEDGSVWRNSTKLIDVGAGSVDRAAFGVYGDYVLIISGSSRLKDTCDGQADFGVVAPDEDLIINLFNTTEINSGNTDTVSTEGIAGHFSNFIAFNGAASVDTDGSLKLVSSTSLTTGKQAFAVNYSSSDFPPSDLSGTPEDYFQFEFKIDDYSKLNPTDTVIISFWRYPSVSHGSIVSAISDYHISFAAGDIVGTSGSGGNWITLQVQRKDFKVSGSSGFDWRYIYTMSITVNTSVQATANFKNFKFFTVKAPTVNDTIGPLNGDYEWVQVNVHSSGNSVSLSKPGPISSVYTLTNGYAEIIPQDPTLLDSTVNEIWIYRRGGDLQDFYRVGRILYNTSNTDVDSTTGDLLYLDLGPLYDNMSDADALSLGIILDTTVLSVNSDDLPDDIIEIVGPIFGRMVYFSASEIFFSEINSPDSYKPSNVMKLASDEAEIFQWARKVAENTIIIGTTKDVYTLVGTFTQFPDGALDVYLRNLSVNKPPISRFAAIWNGSIIYFASQEWIVMSPTGQYQSLVSPNSDILYTGQTRYGYGGVPSMYDNLNVSYACAVAKNKLWCVVPYIIDYDNPSDYTLFGYRMEVFDLGRKYWRPVPYAPFLLTTADDDALYGFFNATMTVNLMDDPFTKLLNAS